jgi:hypothetical protein
MKLIMSTLRQPPCRLSWPLSGARGSDSSRQGATTVKKIGGYDGQPKRMGTYNGSPNRLGVYTGTGGSKSNMVGEMYPHY